MSSIETQVIDGLITQFKTVTLPSGTRVAYPNVNFTPDGTLYVKVNVAKNQPITHKIGGGKEPERMGILLATVFVPIGDGLGAGSDVANAIRDAFKFGTRWEYKELRFFISLEPTVQGEIPGAGSYTGIPVVIPYRVLP